MAREDTLQIQLPVSALGTLAKLLEQVRQLTAGQGPGTEEAGSGSFDPERFRALAAAEASLPQPEAVRAASEGQVPPAASAGAELRELSELSEERPGPRGTMAEAAEAASVRAGDFPLDRAVPAGGPVEAEKALGDAPSVQAGAEGAAQPSREEPQRLPAEVGEELTEAAAVRSEVGDVTEPVPAVRLTETAALEAVPSVAAVFGDGPGQPQGGRMVMAEELTAPGPAPLTAQAVSMAFQRDERRYDAGFPLYQ